VPPLFRQLCIKDVTDEYQTTSDISLNIEKQKAKYAYLCIFNDRNWWNPVAFGKINGNKESQAWTLRRAREKSITYQPVKMAVSVVYPYIREYLGK
jgi:hypothetical protein